MRKFIDWFLYGLLIHTSRFNPSDSFFLKSIYRIKFHEKLDLRHPRTFNQKLQWLKLHNTDPICTRMVDKYGVREIIKDKLGEEYLIPMLGVYDTFADIDFNKLPNQFVLKATHDSGSVVICKDKATFDISAARKKLTEALSKNYFYQGREYPYKGVKPRIIAEKYMEDNSTADLPDFKFFCFNGEPKILFHVTERFSNEGTIFSYYDINLNRLPFTTKGHRVSSVAKLDPIQNYDKMVFFAKSLSQGFPFLRVDFYNINGRVYFGEFTFHHDGGIVPFTDKEWDYKLGEMIKLPIDK